MTQIIPMSLYMIVILYIICFAGEHFYPEPDRAYQFDKPTGFVYPGRLYDWDGSPLFSVFETDNIVTVNGVSY